MNDADAQPIEEIHEVHSSPFEAIRSESEDGGEYWSARDLAEVLGYKTNYRNFKSAIQRAIIACKKSGQEVEDHFAESRKMIQLGKGAQREVEAMRLASYARHLVVQNADPTQ